MVKILLADPAIATVGSFVGSGSGGAAQNNGRMFIALKPPQQRPAVDAVMARLRTETAKLPGISLVLQPIQDIRVGGRSAKALYQYTLRSVDLEDLNTWTPRLVEGKNLGAG